MEVITRQKINIITRTLSLLLSNEKISTQEQEFTSITPFLEITPLDFEIDKNSLKYTIEDVYHKPNNFGYLVDVPSEAPFKTENFKKKCKGNMETI